MTASKPQINCLLGTQYSAGFVTDIEADSVPPGLTEEVIRFIPAKQQEPQLFCSTGVSSTTAYMQALQPDAARIEILAALESIEVDKP